MTSYQGKVVLVTGASTGIGEAAAAEFAAAGASTFGLARTQRSIDAARERHPGVRWLFADVSKPAEINEAVAAVLAETRRLDLLVNNAAVALLGPLEASNDDMIRSQFEINVFGLIYTTRAALPALKASKGQILNISSAAGHRAVAGGSIYGATKAAVESLTKSWALELASSGVRVNAIAPGPTETPMWDKLPIPKEMVSAAKQQSASQVPLGRMATSAEVARWIVHAGDPGVSWMTGHILNIDGGMSLT